MAKPIDSHTQWWNCSAFLPLNGSQATSFAGQKKRVKKVERARSLSCDSSSRFQCNKKQKQSEAKYSEFLLTFSQNQVTRCKISETRHILECNPHTLRICRHHYWITCVVLAEGDMTVFLKHSFSLDIISQSPADQHYHHPTLPVKRANWSRWWDHIQCFSCSGNPPCLVALDCTTAHRSTQLQGSSNGSFRKQGCLQSCRTGLGRIVLAQVSLGQ